ncbi:hypothetical protein [Lysobacter sp. Root494]|uniref:hypothetical protein n=1 Tax=Lysobacter sp. Root494 TaxID=1736549 RepID=UPI0006FD3D29|nr:hypothetical protein [Lysobacter sp. Root494]KQY50372.1 hypothetical protein ASD14_11665 [Lysobacter sp. Root494]
MLLDINTRNGISTLHQLTCRAATTAYATAAKPFGRLGADGGWFPVVDRAHAWEKIAAWSPGLELTDCPMCLTSDVTSA